MADSRMRQGDRLRFTPPESLREALLDHYPMAEYPSLDTEGAVWERAVEDAMRDRPDWIIVFSDGELSRQRIEEFLREN